MTFEPIDEVVNELDIDNKTKRDLGLQSSLPFDHQIQIPGHKKQQKIEKIYQKGIRTDNENEADTFLKRTGAQLFPTV